MFFIYYHIDFGALIAVDSFRKVHFVSQVLLILWGSRQGGLACCCPWGRKELYMTEQLN